MAGHQYEFDPTKFVQPDRSLHDKVKLGRAAQEKRSSTYKYAQQS